MSYRRPALALALARMPYRWPALALARMPDCWRVQMAKL
jgi:hypothetical protein